MGGRLGYRILQEELERFFQLRNGTTISGVGAALGSQVGARIGLFGGPLGLAVGAAVGGLLGGIVGQTLTSLSNGNAREQQQTLQENRAKLEARKYEIEQTIIDLKLKAKELEAQMESLNSEALEISRLLGKINEGEE